MARMSLNDFKSYLRYLKVNDFVNIRKDNKWYKYHKIYCGFDIETTSINEQSYMYIWQFGFKTPDSEQIVVYGRKWSEFVELLRTLRNVFALRNQMRLIIWIANMGYEFQFMRHYIEIDDLFAKEPRQPLYILSDGIEFRDALAVSQGSLQYLAKCWTTTQKAVGDLDYTILRNSRTEMTETELGYTDNDVIILSEFSEKIFDKYIEPEHYIPMTSTGILRHDLRKKAIDSEKNPDALYGYIKSLYPPTKSDYLFIMNYLFRGGFVHACFRKAGDILYNMDSFDLKSSYPAQAFNGYYPRSEFKTIENPTIEIFEEMRKKYCCIVVVTFHNIKSTTAHSIESLSKTIKIRGHKLDNGRVRSADSMTVALTELDYESYEEFYSWESMKIHTMQVSMRGPLPKYLLDQFYYWFQVKESIDKHLNKQDYDISKTRINGHFGLCVTRLVFNDVTYDGTEWLHTESSQTYDQMIAKQVLSPYWGIWMTAGSRRVEISLLYKMQKEVAYSDTDSHKLELTSNAIKVIHCFNKETKAKNRAMCEKFGYDIKVIGKIGTLEWETAPNGEHGIMSRFKTLGAKRYICEYKKGGFESTISGLGKKALEQYCTDNDIDPFTAFEHNLTIPPEITNKLSATYIDKPTSCVVTDAQGHSETMKEKSSIYLKPVSFTLSLDKDYISLLAYHLERIKKHG